MLECDFFFFFCSMYCLDVCVQSRQTSEQRFDIFPVPCPWLNLKKIIIKKIRN